METEQTALRKAALRVFEGKDAIHAHIDDPLQPK
jgi:hypothetical protein